MYISFRETLENEWTSKAVCESCADWLKFEDLSNRDQLAVDECINSQKINPKKKKYIYIYIYV